MTFNTFEILKINKRSINLEGYHCFYYDKGKIKQVISIHAFISAILIFLAVFFDATFLLILVILILHVIPIINRFLLVHPPVILDKNQNRIFSTIKNEWCDLNDYYYKTRAIGRYNIQGSFCIMHDLKGIFICENYFYFKNSDRVFETIKKYKKIPNSSKNIFKKINNYLDSDNYFK